MDARTLLKECRAQLKAGDARDAMLRLRNAVRERQLSPEQLEQAGRLIASHVVQSGAVGTRVRILGQCTTSWLVPALTAVAWGDQHVLHVEDAEYDNIVQTLMSTGDLSSDVVVLLPWNRGLLADSALTLSERISSEMEVWAAAWGLLAERGASRLVQVGYDWITPGHLGGHLSSGQGDVALVRSMNEQLRAALPQGAAFVDLAEISGQMGREVFYDPRRYYWTKQPFSEAGTVRLAEHVHAAVRAVTTGPKKVLVLDLDNTLWGGVVGELGPLGVSLGEGPEGEAFCAFQTAVLRLARRGIVLAVASKNNPDDAMGPFANNPDMVLAADDFAAFEACWDPKDVVLRRIATQLRLGLEHFVFFDDNPAERELIRQTLPDVSVVEVPDEPAEFVRALERGLYFESTSLTAEDLERTAHYRIERERVELERSVPTLAEYLTSLDMRGSIQPICGTNMQRAIQLLGKTNQWNLSTRRLSEPEVRAILTAPGSIGLMLRLVDRFGDYGLISLLLASREGDTMRITDWLMSCRTIGRTVEQFVFLHFLDLAREAGVRVVTGEYVRTKKNQMVADLYQALGFESLARDDERASYALDVDMECHLKTFIRPA